MGPHARFYLTSATICTAIIATHLCASSDWPMWFKVPVIGGLLYGTIEVIGKLIDE